MVGTVKPVRLSARLSIGRIMNSTVRRLSPQLENRNPKHNKLNQPNKPNGLNKTLNPEP